MKLFGKDWPLGLTPFDYEPSVWKILIEGVLYYFGVAIIKELYVRGLFLNIVDRFAHKKEHHAVIAIWVSSIVFGLGHIPGLIGMDLLVILFKVISTIGISVLIRYINVAFFAAIICYTCFSKKFKNEVDEQILIIKKEEDCCSVV